MDFNTWLDSLDIDSEIKKAEDADARSEFAPLAEGWYMCSVIGATAGESSQKHTPYIKLTFRAAHQVRKAQLETGEIAAIPVKRTFRHTFYLTEKAMQFGFVPFCKATGYKPVRRQEGEDYGEAVARIAAGCVGLMLECKVKHPDADDQGRIWPEIDVFANSCHGMRELDTSARKSAGQYFSDADEYAKVGKTASADADDSIPF